MPDEHLKSGTTNNTVEGDRCYQRDNRDSKKSNVKNYQTLLIIHEPLLFPDKATEREIRNRADWRSNFNAEPSG